MPVIVQVLKVRALVRVDTREVWFPWRYVPVAFTNGCEIRLEPKEIYPDAGRLIAAAGLVIGFFQTLEIVMPSGERLVRHVQATETNRRDA
jgi:hypothetical protein